MRDGRVICLHDGGVAEVAGQHGRIIHDNPIGPVRFRIDVGINNTNIFGVLPDGRCVIGGLTAKPGAGVAPTGQTLRTTTVNGAWGVETLRGGHYLVNSKSDYRIVEVDAQGRSVWEAFTRDAAGPSTLGAGKVCTSASTSR